MGKSQCHVRADPGVDGAFPGRMSAVVPPALLAPADKLAQLAVLRDVWGSHLLAGVTIIQHRNSRTRCRVGDRHSGRPHSHARGTVLAH